MCNKSDLQNLVNDYRELTSIKQEVEAQMDSIKNQLVEYLMDNDIDEYIGTDFKMSYKPQSRASFDRKALESVFGSEIIKYQTYKEYRVFRLK